MIVRCLGHSPALGNKPYGRLHGFRSARLGSSHRIVHRVMPDMTRATAITPRKDTRR